MIVLSPTEFERLARHGRTTVWRRDPLAERRHRARPRNSNDTVIATVVAQTRLNLAEIDDEQAGQLGFGSAGEMRRWWREHFEGVHPPASERQFPGPVFAWRVTLELDRTDPPRLLGRGRHVSDLGYVQHPARALRGEPEAVPADWQEWITETARRQHARRSVQLARQAARAMTNAANELEHHAKQAGLDWSSQARTVRHLARRLLDRFNELEPQPDPDPHERRAA